jgi:hypothetical protein
MDRQEKIGLIVLDIDGVLTEGEGAGLDLGLMNLLADLNRRARRVSGVGTEATVPSMTLCTGRPQPYVEAFAQAMDCSVPAVFEGGAGIYIPQRGRSLLNPVVKDLSKLNEVRNKLRAAASKDPRFYLQLGKEFTISVFPEDPRDLGLLRDFVLKSAGTLVGEIETAYSASCINVQPKGCDKGTGMEFLSDLTGVPLMAMLGVGDSEVDLPFLARVGHSAAPANASADVIALAGYVSPFRTAEGVKDILAHFGVY